MFWVDEYAKVWVTVFGVYKFPLASAYNVLPSGSQKLFDEFTPINGFVALPVVGIPDALIFDTLTVPVIELACKFPL